MRIRTYVTMALVWILLSLLAYATVANSPVGSWISVSDKTGDRSAVVQIWQQNGQLYGKIAKIFPGNGRQVTDRCEKCPAPFTNKPNVGLTILWGLTPNNNGGWSNGQILDPQEGKIYRASIKLSPDGKQLDVTGHWGVFSRTQTWSRAK